jgi:hypothetical protein
MTTFLDDLPPELVMAIQVWQDDPKQFVSAPGTAALRNLLNGNGTAEATWDELGPWLDERAALFEELAEVHALLLEAEPLTDPDNMPAWPWTWWGQTLNEAWAEDLAVAIGAAKGHLAGL